MTERTLSVGSTYAATPCVVTVDSITMGLAHGECQTCRCRHVLSVSSYEAGRGLWKLVESENPAVSVSSLSREDLLTVLNAWFQADFGDRDACLAAERLAAHLGLEAAQETS